MKDRIYLDYAATTPVSDEALKAMHVHIRNGRESCYRVFIRRYGEQG